MQQINEYSGLFGVHGAIGAKYNFTSNKLKITESFVDTLIEQSCSSKSFWLTFC